MTIIMGIFVCVAFPGQFLAWLLSLSPLHLLSVRTVWSAPRCDNRRTLGFPQLADTCVVPLSDDAVLCLLAARRTRSQYAPPRGVGLR